MFVVAYGVVVHKVPNMHHCPTAAAGLNALAKVEIPRMFKWDLGIPDD
jgi:hypothetical protein